MYEIIGTPPIEGAMMLSRCAFTEQAKKKRHTVVFTESGGKQVLCTYTDLFQRLHNPALSSC